MYQKLNELYCTGFKGNNLIALLYPTTFIKKKKELKLVPESIVKGKIFALE